MSQFRTDLLLTYTHILPKPITCHMQNNSTTATFVDQDNTAVILHTLSRFAEAIEDG